MSGSNRRRDLATLVVSLVVIAGVFIAGTWYLGSLQGHQSERRQQAPASYRQSAKADAQTTCAGRDAAAAFECIYEKVEASQDQARGEQDLTAQQQAALAATASAIVALLTLLVSAVGIYFIWRTIQQAYEHTHVQLRAYVRFSSCRIRRIGDRKWELEGLIINKGQTPVTVRFLTEEHIRRWPIERDPPLPDFGSLERYGVTAHIGPDSPKNFQGGTPKLDAYWEEEIRAGRACIISRQQLEYATYAGESVRFERDLYARGSRFDKRDGMKALGAHHYADSEWQQWLRSQEDEGERAEP